MIGGLSILIADSSVDGWATSIVYVATAWLCLHNARASIGSLGDGSRGTAKAQARRRFWSILATLILLLGLTRQLDLQALLSAMARRFVDADGAYDARAGFQLALVIAVGTFGAVGLAGALFTFRRVEGSTLVAAAGAALLFTFSLIRTIGLRDIDAMLREGPPHAQINTLVEIGSLLIIVAASYAFVRRLHGEGESARLRSLALQERRRRLLEKRRMA